MVYVCCVLFFFFNDPATTEIYTLSLHDALPIYLDSTATPRSFVFGSNATILNVEGRARVIAAGNGRTLFRRFPAPVTLMLVPQLRDLVDARPPRSVRSPARPRADVSRVSAASCVAPLGPVR